MGRHGHTDLKGTIGQRKRVTMLLKLGSHEDALVKKTSWGSGTAKLCIVGEPFSIHFFPYVSELVFSSSGFGFTMKRAASLHNRVT